MKKLAAGLSLVALVTVLGAILLGACNNGGDAGPPPKPVYPDFINVTGTLTLKGASYVRGSISDCAGAARFADLLNGAPVTVSNSRGMPLAVGKIIYSVGTNVFRNRLDECVFKFAVNNVQADRTGYSVAIAGQPPYKYTFLQMMGVRGSLSMLLPTAHVVTTTTLPMVTRPSK